MSTAPLQTIIDDIEKMYTHGELRKYLAQLLLDVKYANAYLPEAWEVVYPNPAERLHYMKITENGEPFVTYRK